jgi:hypothetical protein
MDLDNPNLYLLTHILVSLYIFFQGFPMGLQVSMISQCYPKWVWFYTLKKPDEV